MDEKTAAARQTARTAIDYVVVAVNEGQDTFTGSYFTQDEVSYVLHIVVKEGAKAPALSLPASDALDVVWETAPRSRSELHELRAALAKQNNGSFVSIGTNIAAGRLVLTVKEGANPQLLDRCLWRICRR